MSLGIGSGLSLAASGGKLIYAGPAFVNKGSESSGSSSGTINSTAPASLVNGNLLIAFVASYGGAVLPSVDPVQAGWTLIEETTISDTTQFIRAKSMYRYVVGGEPASYDFLVTNLATYVMTIAQFANVRAGGPISAQAEATVTIANAQPDPVSPGITTLQPQTLALSWLAHSHLAVAATHTPANGETEVFDFSVSSGSARVASHLTMRNLTRALAIGSVVHDCTNNVNNTAVLQRFALRSV